MEPFIYLDHNATTPLDPIVLEAMMPYLTSVYGNASSLTHAWGRHALTAVDQARAQIAAYIGASRPDELVFTSGSTESINTVIKGIFERYRFKGKHFITCTTEHKAVLDSFAAIEKKGAEVTYIGVNSKGELDLSEVENAFRSDTVLLCIMSANNETGVIHPIRELAQLAANRGVLSFCDATQSVGKLALNLQETPLDLVCFNAHKIYGPKGVGALYIRRKNTRIQIDPLLHGGNQELGRRAGTLNVPGIIGFAAALERAVTLRDAENERLAGFRDRLEIAFLRLPQVVVNGSGAPRLPHVSNLRIRHLQSLQLLAQLPMLGLSTGSACVSGDRQPSHVLTAMGLDPTEVRSSLRISLGRGQTSEDVGRTIELMRDGIQRLREESPAWQLYRQGLID